MSCSRAHARTEAAARDALHSSVAHVSSEGVDGSVGERLLLLQGRAEEAEGVAAELQSQLEATEAVVRAVRTPPARRPARSRR